MMIEDKTRALQQFLRDQAVRHYRRWLPYAAVLLFLTVIWVFWDNSTGRIQQTTGETKRSQERSAPVFLGKNKTGNYRDESLTEDRRQAVSDPNVLDTPSGTLICDVSKARRGKPLPDLFAGNVPTLSKTAPAISGFSVSVSGQGGDAVRSVPAGKRDVVPVSCGLMETDTIRLIILRHGEQTRACGTGDRFAGYTVVYIGRDVVGLEKYGEITEIKI